MKTHLNLFVMTTICLSLVSCSGGQPSSSPTLDPSGVVRGSPLKGSGESGNFAVPAIASHAELDKIRDFAINSTLPLQSKSKLISVYVSALAQKYNVNRDIITQQVSAYFQIQNGDIQSPDYTIQGVSKLSGAISSLRSKVAVENGAALTGDGSDSLSLVSRMQEIQVLRSNTLQESLLSVQEQRKEQVRQTQALFRAIDREAQKNADAIVAAIEGAKVQDQVEPKSIISWKEIARDTEKTQAVAAGAQIAESIGNQTGLRDEQKKAMVPYLANAVLKYGLVATLNGYNGKSTLSVSLEKSSVRDAVGNLAKACNGLSKFAGDRSESLKKINLELSNFSKGGAVKLEVGGFIDVESIRKLQESAAKIDSKVKEYTGAAETLIQLAEILQIDRNVINTAKEGVKVARTAETVLSAFVTPTPANIMSAVGSVFGKSLGIAGPSPDEVMNAKLDSIMNMQKIELHELAEIKQGIYSIQKEIAQVETLIGEVSKQIATTSQILYDQLINIESGVQELAAMEQRQERELTGASDCDHLASALRHQNPSVSPKGAKYQLRRELFSPEVSPFLDGCSRFISLINPETDTSRQFLDVSKVASSNQIGKNYATILQLTNPASNPNTALPMIALNPVGNFFDLVKLYDPRSSIRLDSSAAATNTMKNIATYYQGKDELFDSLLVTQYADLVTKVSPLINLYQKYQAPSQEPGSNVTDILSSMMEPEGSYQSWLTHLMEMVNINIAQQVLLSGASITNWDIGTVLKLNAHRSGNSNGSSATDPLFSILSQSPDIRRNILMYDLIKDLKDQKLGTMGYDYLTRLPHDNDSDFNSMLSLIQDSFTSPWPLMQGKMQDGSKWVFTQIAQESESLPTGLELSQGMIKYSPELKLLLAARENLLDLMTEMRVGEISDQNIKDQIFRRVLKRAL